MPSESTADPYSCTYTLQRIGTAQEKQSVDKELSELRERLSHVEEWTRRRDEIDEDLRHVLVEGGRDLPPSYEQTEAQAGELSEKAISGADAERERHVLKQEVDAMPEA